MDIGVWELPGKSAAPLSLQTGPLLVFVVAPASGYWSFQAYVYCMTAGTTEQSNMFLATHPSCYTPSMASSSKLCTSCPLHPADRGSRSPWSTPKTPEESQIVVSAQ